MRVGIIFIIDNCLSVDLKLLPTSVHVLCCYIFTWPFRFALAFYVIRVVGFGFAFIRSSRGGTRLQVVENNDDTRHVVTTGTVAVGVRRQAEVEHLQTEH